MSGIRTHGAHLRSRTGCGGWVLDRFGTAVPEHVKHVSEDYWAWRTGCTAAQWRAARGEQ